jgi:hypothetical protein
VEGLMRAALEFTYYNPEFEPESIKVGQKYLIEYEVRQSAEERDEFEFEAYKMIPLPNDVIISMIYIRQKEWQCASRMTREGVNPSTLSWWNALKYVLMLLETEAGNGYQRDLDWTMKYVPVSA